tara:strand:+ start:14879 stop:17194 length:2316 start_codon:yes stop_codon:yes gene_type:complete
MLNTANILNLLSNDQGLEVKKLEKILKLTKKNDRNKLSIALKALVKLDLLTEINENQYVYNLNHNYIKARIRCSSKGYCFAVRDDSEDDIYIREHHLNHAWHGDIVLIKILKEAQKRRSPEGIVKCILERNTSNIISRLVKIDNNIKAIPLDDRLLENIELTKPDESYYEEDENNNIVEVKINRYPIAQYSAIGSITKKLPLDKGIEGDLNILLSKSNINDDIIFPSISSKNISTTNRIDLTKQDSLLFNSWSSHSPGCLPALYLEPIEGGTRVWVHSPTLSERISLTGKLGDFLRQRGEALCLGKKWRNFISNDIIDLAEFRVGKVNEAISISFDLDNSAKILNWQFYLSRIKPSAIVEAKELESIASRKPNAKSIPILLKPLKDYINQIQSILYFANKLNDSNHEILELDNSIPMINHLKELNFCDLGTKYNGWESPINYTDPQSILNIFIRQANAIWYTHSKNYDINTVIVKNNSLDDINISDIVKAAVSLNVNIELDENGYINAKNLFKNIKKSSSKSLLEKILKQNIKNKTIQLSINENSSLEKQFDNISSLLYQSPWTLPSINYVNLINQLLIVLLLKEGKSKEKSRSKDTVNLGSKDSWNNLNWSLFNKSVITQIDSLVNNSLIDDLNKIRYKFSLFNNNLISMAQSRAAEKLIGKNIEGFITGVQSYGFFTEISENMIEGLVHVSTLNDDWYEYRSRQNLLIGRKNKKTYKIGDFIQVKVLSVDLLKNQVDLEVVENINDFVNDKNKIKTDDLDESTPSVTIT